MMFQSADAADFPLIDDWAFPRPPRRRCPERESGPGRYNYGDIRRPAPTTRSVPHTSETVYG